MRMPSGLAKLLSTGTKGSHAEGDSKSSFSSHTFVIDSTMTPKHLTKKQSYVSHSVETEHIRVHEMLRYFIFGVCKFVSKLLEKGWHYSFFMITVACTFIGMSLVCGRSTLWRKRQLILFTVTAYILGAGLIWEKKQITPEEGTYYTTKRHQMQLTVPKNNNCR